MAALTEHAFRRLAAAGTLAPAYYLVGDDDFRKDEAMMLALVAAVPENTRAFNLEIRRGPELTADALATLVGTPPMVSTRRAVAIRDVGALRKDARQVLDRYLVRPAADTVLLLVTSAGAKPDRGLADRAVTVEFPVLTGDRVPKWIAHRASELGATVTPGAAALLQSALGGDLAHLANALDALVSYGSGGPAATATVGETRAPVTIDDAAVAAVVGVRRGETLGDLLDRVAARDVGGSLALLGPLLAQPKMAGVPIVMALTAQMLAIALGVALRAEGTPPSRLRQEMFGLLKATGSVLTGRPWGEAIDNWVRATDHWTPAALDRALAALLAADVALKDSRVSTDEQVLATLVLEICTAAAATRSRAA